MKNQTIIIILAILLISGTFLIIQSENKPSLDNVVSTSTTTSNSDEIKQDVSNDPLTLASLKARADWNPTLENDWMYRVEDGVPTLSDETKDVKNHTIYVEESIAKGITFIHYDDNFLSEFCTKKTMSDLPGVLLKCPHYKPSAYNEFIILSKDTGEVLHKYKLKAGYTMLIESTTVIGSAVPLSPGDYTAVSLYISKIEHQDGEEVITSSFSYTLNVVTGEITLE